MTATTFATALAEERQRAGWSQAHLAAEAGYDHSYISRLELGKREPSRDTVEALCAVLGLDHHRAGLLLMAAGLLPNRPGWRVRYERNGEDANNAI